MLDMPMELTPMLMVSPSDTPLVKTPSPRDSSPRGPLMLTLLSSMEPMDTPTPMPMFLSDPALDLPHHPGTGRCHPGICPLLWIRTLRLWKVTRPSREFNIKPNKLLFMIAATDNCNIQ